MSYRTITLGEVLTVRPERFKPTYEVIANLQRIDKIDFSGRIHLSNKSSNTDMILVRKGDLVISGINVAKGACAVYTAEEDVTATIHYSSYRYNPDLIDIEYLKVFLKSPDFVALLKEQVPGGIKTEIKPKHILSLKVQLPELLVQQRIFQQFRREEGLYNTLQVELDKQDDLLKKLKQAILQDAVEGKLTTGWREKHGSAAETGADLLVRIQAEKAELVKAKQLKKGKPLPPIIDAEKPFELPEGWVWCRLGELSEIGTGATPLTTLDEYYGNGNIPWITSSATNTPFVDKAEKMITEKALRETNCKVYPKGTLVIAMYGQGKTRGQITELRIDAATNQACAAIRFYIEAVFLKSYTKIFFQNIYDQIRELATGGAQPNLNMQKINLTVLPLPPLAEQQAIVEAVERAMEKLGQLREELTHQREKANELLKALLHKAFQVEEGIEGTNDRLT